MLLVNGSPHAHGNTKHALQVVESALRCPDIETAWFELGTRPVRGCIACGRCAATSRCVFKDDKANELIEAMLASDAVILGSPVYFAGPNGAFCALLDRAFFAAAEHGQLLAGKLGAAVAKGMARGRPQDPGPQHAQDARGGAGDGNGIEEVWATYYVRMDRGDEIVGSLLGLCERERVMSATFSGIGGCGHAEIQTFIPETGQFELRSLDGMLELVSLTGNVVTDEGATYFHHTHGVFAYKDGAGHHVAGGRIRPVTVSYAAEIELGPVRGGRITRSRDAETGTGFWSFAGGVTS